MCKLIILTNASKIEDFDDFSRQAAEWLDQNDGYGHAVQGDKGIFGVRTLDPEVYTSGVTIPPFVDNPTRFFGLSGKITGAALLHGRISTNSVSFTNTHPIERDAWHLIHNGVVTHHGEKYVQNTSNDSEHVLYNLINGIESVATNLTGYYALGAFDPSGQLHVMRDAIAPLFYAYSKTLDSDIFATTEALIEDIGEYIEETLTALKVRDNTYLVYKDNKLVSNTSFKSRGYDTHSKGLAGKSLGKDHFDSWDMSYAYEEELMNSIDEDYLEEIDNYLDDSFTIKQGDKQIEIDEFRQLRLTEQVECEVSRYDGSKLKPFKVTKVG